MKGLSYPPVLESEVLVLFGMLIPHLDDEFIVKEFNSSPGFPDCYALRNGEEIGIEFEVDSRNFYEHKHHMDPDVDKCNLIVCYKNPLDSYIKVNKQGKEHRIEIFELKRIIEEKSLHEKLFPIKNLIHPLNGAKKRFYKS